MEDIERRAAQGKKAWEMGQIIAKMNNEEAYYSSGWLYTWPDGETYADCLADFGEDDESYADLEAEFKRVYTEYHDDGLYKAPNAILLAARAYDKEFGLPPIENLG
jgi:hypothetical protein